ncbi:MAG: phosphate propanoyltransferase [Bacilli bacterium]|nr:phosphate propanoyltransferase [Bacilli bacterium]
MKVPIGISARHAHLTKEHLEILFGKNYNLVVLKELSQPGEFASAETITVKGEKGVLDKFRIIGPIRKYSQVEISKTDSYALGVKPPVRESGDIKGTSPITLIGPKGEVHLDEGCIIANRHIHITPNDVKKLGLEGITNVSVLIDGPKGGIMHNVNLKVSANYQYELHLDTDDGNAFLINQGDKGTILIDK